MKNLLFIALLFFSSQVVAQTEEPVPVSIEDLGFLIGEWEGTLEYLDYQDDSTKVQLPVIISCVAKGSKLRLNFNFTEPNGKTVSNKEDIKAGSKPGTLVWGEEWMVKELKLSPSGKDGLNSITLVQEGKDNDKEATIQLRLMSMANRLAFRKEVTYKGEEESFVRNTYKLKVKK
ncbi:MAG: hypothetical protein AAFO07_22650 [Bacteroidota bacterium]